jgi:SAM-dependent methyltransferase
MLDYLDGTYDGSFCYVRDDGHASPLDIATRFSDYPDFTAAERDACALADGRVLDVGCGSGKHLEYLRARGLHCSGIDNSATVMRVLRRQGIGNALRMDAFRLGFAADSFDSVTLFANGLSMGGSVPGMRALLAEFSRVTSAAGRVVVTNLDVRQSLRPADHRYHQANLAAGRLPGQLTLRSRYRGVTGEPFPWLFVSPVELRDLLAGAGWRIADVLEYPGGTYCALLVKVG